MGKKGGARGVATAASYAAYDLNNFCGAGLHLGFQDDDADRAGTLSFLSYPDRSCTVNVTVEGVPPTDLLAIYFNIRHLKLCDDDFIFIFEYNYTNDPFGDKNGAKLVKMLQGGYVDTAFNPTSVAQLRSNFAWKVGFSIHFHHNPFIGPLEASGPLELDYNVLRQTNNPSNGYSSCAALSGYVRDDVYCETGDRVNCPSHYNDQLGLNFARGKDQGPGGRVGHFCPQPNEWDSSAQDEYVSMMTASESIETTITWDPDATEEWSTSGPPVYTSSSYSGYDNFVMRTIVTGFGLTAFLLGCFLRWAFNRRRIHRQDREPLLPGQMSAACIMPADSLGRDSSDILAGHGYPYPPESTYDRQQQLVFQDPPPSYEEAQRNVASSGVEHSVASQSSMVSGSWI
ncbi:hypothetical protein BV898_01017 [Hypsibius exemplaris]|uniref:Uncharacterized protein n=1 Tax=Hypsibius exemplaris TaxID=2072580 RepID=A0A1W0XCX4_HYPEX|nr:hypothetical protein BV898_01017 [Hypsibius exemplaris]